MNRSEFLKARKQKNIYRLVGVNQYQKESCIDRWQSDLLYDYHKQRGFPYHKILRYHLSCINTITFSRHDGALLASGSDDMRILIWDPLGSPKQEDTWPLLELHGHTSNVFCTAFSHDNRQVLSSGNDDAALLFDLEHTSSLTTSGNKSTIPICRPISSYLSHSSCVYKVAWSCDSPYQFASASEDGHVMFWDTRTKPEPFAYLSTRNPFHTVEYHPNGTQVLTAQTANGITLHDLRMLREQDARPSSESYHSTRSNTNYVARYSTLQFRIVTGISIARSGTHFIASVIHFYPMMYTFDDPNPRCIFYSNTYRHSCTMKGISFDANETHVLSGSDNFGIYIWPVPRVQDLPYLTECAKSNAKEQEKLFLGQDQSDGKKLSSIKFCLKNTPADNTSPAFTPEIIASSALCNYTNNDVDDTLKRLYTLSLNQDLLVVSAPERVIQGSRSIINNVVAHPKLPVFASAGIEKVVRLWSPHPLSELDPESPLPLNPRKHFIFNQSDNVQDVSNIFLDQLGNMNDTTVHTSEESPQTLGLFDFFLSCESQNYASRGEMDARTLSINLDSAVNQTTYWFESEDLRHLTETDPSSPSQPPHTNHDATAENTTHPD
ncbi:DDB1- and CUL4-associated factor 5-like [Schistocerca gregaria]|uniref:DDB1- and CUL4-associated factor 5-like n=1 Tax=Schistocerca gregaria TaxID=7010 RepID=UPI00211E868A|nr:DDB1- and CUL4-associated factor 5-like [Schistocerca gregaria]XP_049849095.1 DDB1- and CUL4-associated factor 5-like [Schistocerca gregaria]